MKFPNVMLPGEGPMGYADVGTALEASTVTWPDLRWIRDAWNGKIVVKGVHIGEDARRAVDAGADAVVVSNHGGRQLDGVHPTVRALPEVVEAVNGQAEVLLDGGIRRGSDVAKALCLGARAVLVGRAYAYGLGAAGGPGVSRAIEILQADLLRTIKLLGCPSAAKLNQSYVDIPAEWQVPAAQPRGRDVRSAGFSCRPALSERPGRRVEGLSRQIVGPAVLRDVEVPGLPLGDAQRLPLRSRKVLREQHDLPHVRRVVGHLAIDRFDDRVRFPSHADGFFEVRRREGRDSPQHAAPAVFPHREDLLARVGLAQLRTRCPGGDRASRRPTSGSPSSATACCPPCAS